MTSPVHITRTIRELEAWIAKREAVNARRRRQGNPDRLRLDLLVRAARQLTEYRDALDRELPVVRPPMPPRSTRPNPGVNINPEFGDLIGRKRRPL